MSEETGAVCIANIGAKGRRQRMNFGLVLLGISVLLAAVLIGTGVGRSWRLVVLLPLWGAGLGIFQARGRTWSQPGVARSARHGHRHRPAVDHGASRAGRGASPSAEGAPQSRGQRPPAHRDPAASAGLGSVRNRLALA